MRELFIVRHAWAGEHGDPRYPNDALRPLTDDGRRRFRDVVRTLRERGFAPRAVAASPLVRCRQTAEIVVAETDAPPLVALDALAPGSNLAELIAWTRRQNADAVAWVGHAPDVSRLTAELIGDGRACIRFAKGTVAAIRFDEEIGVGLGELAWLATAKLLGV